MNDCETVNQDKLKTCMRKYESEQTKKKRWMIWNYQSPQTENNVCVNSENSVCVKA